MASTAPPTEFDFKVLVNRFEALSKLTVSNSTDSPTVPLKEFADCMLEFTKVFGALGSGFAFAFKDLDEKIEVLQLAAPVFGDVRSGLVKDIESSNVVPKDKPGFHGVNGTVSITRAVNRTAHVCIFLTMFFQKLLDSKETKLKEAICDAYENSLVKIHAWIVRNSVRLAFKVVPSREKFLASAKIDEAMIAEVGPSFVKASVAVTGIIKKEFEERGIKWEF